MTAEPVHPELTAEEAMAPLTSALLDILDRERATGLPVLKHRVWAHGPLEDDEEDDEVVVEVTVDLDEEAAFALIHRLSAAARQAALDLGFDPYAGGFLVLWNAER